MAILNLVVGYPGDAAPLVDLLAEAVEEVNAEISSRLDTMIRLWRWPDDSRPGIHAAGPQAIIDDAIRPHAADLFVGLFHARLGTPDPQLDGDTGTQHEFRLAYESRVRSCGPEIFLYFADIAHEEPLKEFRKSLPKDVFYWKLSLAGVGRTFREHLRRFVERRPGRFSFAERFEWRSLDLYRTGKSSARSDSALLVAANEAVPFLGREPLIASLADWALAIPPRVSVRTLVGQGGSGKTRTALELAKRLRQNGWTCLWAAKEAENATATGTLQIGPTRPTLLIFDYASSFVRALTRALPDLRKLESEGAPVRILLLDRAERGWYSHLLEHTGERFGVRELFEEEEPTRLQPFDKRRELFQAGLDAWASAKGRTPLRCPPPGTSPAFDEGLVGRTWSDPLYLLIASFVAAQYERIEPALEKTRLDLVEYAAMKEYAEISRRTGPEKESEGAALASVVTVAGGAKPELLDSFVESAGCPSDWTRIVPILEDLYGDSGGSVAPIEPDPVAEAFLLYSWRAARNRVRHIDQVLDYAATLGSADAVVSFLTKTCQTFGWLEMPSARQSLDGGPLQVQTALDALDRFISRRQLNARRILELLPTSTETVALREFRLRITQRTRIEAPDVDLLLDEAECLSSLGRSHEAIDLLRAGMTQETEVGIRARLLESLANALSATGEREQAVDALEEAVRLQAASEASGSHLASALNNFANRCYEAGRWPQALSASQAAEKIYRDLVADGGPRLSDALARTLTSQAAIWNALEDRPQALATNEEALSIFRDLAQTWPDSYESNLADALVNAAKFLGTAGRLKESASAAAESVEILRRLEQKIPGAFQPSLAGALRCVATRLQVLRQHEPAADAAAEAYHLFSTLAKSFPKLYTRELAESLRVLAAGEAQLGDKLTAADLARQAVELVRPLAQTEPAVFEPELAQSLSVLSSYLCEGQHANDAIPVAAESVEIFRRLASVSKAFISDLAESLRAYAVALNDTGQNHEALSVASESVHLREALGPSYRSSLARSLELQASVLGRLDRNVDAVQSIDKAAALLEELTQSNPDAYQGAYAQVLSTKSGRLHALGRHEEALQAVDAAIVTRQALVTQSTEDDQLAKLARLLGLRGAIMQGTREYQFALRCYAEGCAILLPLLASRQEELMPLVAKLSHDYISLRSEVGNPLPVPLDDETLVSAIFSEPSIEITGYRRPS